MKTIILFTFFLIVPLTSYTQVTQEWVVQYGGNEFDISEDMVVDSQGNIYVTGWGWGNGTNYDFATVKYNSAGVEQWVARYNRPGNGSDKAIGIAIDAQNNIYVTGYSETGTQAITDIITVKYNSAGLELWVAIYDGPANALDIPRDIDIDAHGNIYVTGASTGTATSRDFVTIKYDPTGSQQWVARTSGPGAFVDGVNAVTHDDQGNVYVTGSSSVSFTNIDFLTVKYNSSGIEQWASRYNGPANTNDLSYAISLDDQGNVYVTGSSVGIGTSLDFATIKYNSAGAEQWVARYNGPDSTLDESNDIVLDEQGNIYVTGSSRGIGTLEDYTTIKYNPSGIEQWIARYSGPGSREDYANAIVLDDQNNVYITGASTGTDFSLDFATVKYNSTGIEQWVARHDGFSNELCLDGQGNVYVTGNSNGIGNSSDFTTIKYSQSVGIQQISTTLPDGFSLSQNYPNPFNPSTKIRFAIPNSSFLKLAVYDILGREVSSLVNEQLNAGTYEYEFDAGILRSGIYFYKLEAAEYTETKKMLLIK